MTKRKNLFATVLTYPAPSSNYRGESEENRTVLQKITKNNKEYCIVSPEAMRNALREMLSKEGLPSNRSRLHNEDQLAVEFKSFPNAEEYADDYLFGFMVADKEAVKNNKDKPAKRDSVLRMNMAVALAPYRFNAVFNQSPKNAGTSPWKNSSTSALLMTPTVSMNPGAFRSLKESTKPIFRGMNSGLVVTSHAKWRSLNGQDLKVMV